MFLIFDDIAGRFLLKRVIPFYFFIKLIFLVYLFHPKTLGARYLYEFVISPKLKGHKADFEKFSKLAQETVKEFVNWNLSVVTI